MTGTGTGTSPNPNDPSTWDEDENGLPIEPPGYVPQVTPIPPNPRRDADGEPLADPLFSATGYAVQIATANPDGSATVFMEAVADTPRQLTELLRTIALRVAAPVRLYDDNSNLIPLATYIVSIRDRARDVWVKADGVTPMPEGAVWSNIEVKVNVGSVTL